MLQKRKQPRWCGAARGIVCKSEATRGFALQRNSYVSPRELYMWSVTLSQILCNYPGGTELWRMAQSIRKFLGIGMRERKGNGSLFSLQEVVGRQWSNCHLWKLWKGLKFLLANRCMLGKHCKVEVCDVNAGVAFTGRIINIWTILPRRSKDRKKKKKRHERDQEGTGEKTPIMLGHQQFSFLQGQAAQPYINVLLSLSKAFQSSPASSNFKHDLQRCFPHSCQWILHLVPDEKSGSLQAEAGAAQKKIWRPS